MIWQTSRYQIDLTRVRIMGVVNVTPDSFSDGGRYFDAGAAIAHCEQLVREGADILDIGGESSRPGAQRVGAQEELDRILPVVEGALRLGCPVSLDTTKPELMRHGLRMGVDIINDINALQSSEALAVVAASDSCGIVLDPGLGFGKTVENNVELLARQRELLDVGFPLLVGWSRKSTLGLLTGRPVHERQTASVAAALASVQNGAAVIRVHDVAATADALSIWRAAGLCH